MHIVARFPPAGRGDEARSEDAGTEAPQRDDQSDRPAVGVDDPKVELGIAQAGQRPGGERPVQLDGVARSPPADASAARAVLAASTGPMPKYCGATPLTARAAIRASGACRVSRNWGAVADRRGAVVEGGSIAWWSLCYGPERRAELCQGASMVGVGADAPRLAPGLYRGPTPLHRRTSRPGPGRRKCPLMAAQGETVLLVPPDGILVGEQLGTFAGSHDPLLRHPGVYEPPAQCGRNQFSELGPAGKTASGLAITHGARVIDSTPPAIRR